MQVRMTPIVSSGMAGLPGCSLPYRQGAAASGRNPCAGKGLRAPLFLSAPLT
jgi:hypothetical protein